MSSHMKRRSSTRGAAPPAAKKARTTRRSAPSLISSPCQSCDSEDATLVCEYCETAIYCSKKCQQDDLPRHELACTRTSNGIYTIQEKKDGYYVKVMNRKENKMARIEKVKANVERLDDFFNTPFMRSREEFRAKDILLMDEKPFHMVTELKKDKEIITPFARYLTPESMKKINGGDIVYLHELINRKETKEAAGKAQTKSHKKNKGGRFDGALTREPSREENSLRCSRWIDGDINRVLGRIIARTMAYAFPEVTTGSYEKRWASHASLTLGHEDNTFISSTQVNFSMPAQPHNLALGNKGEFHIDTLDDPNRLSATLFLSNLEENKFPGLFTIASVGLTCPASTGGCLIFSAKHPHFGKPAQPYPLPLADMTPSQVCHRHPDFDFLPEETHLEQRVVIVGYPNDDALRAKPDQVHPEVWDSAAFMGTIRNLKESKMRAHIKELVRKRPEERSDEHLIRRLLKDFSWTNEDGVIEEPRRRVAELAIEWTGKIDPVWEEMIEANRASGCGRSMPGEKTKDANDTALFRKRRKAGLKRVLCGTMTARGSPCQTLYYEGEGHSACSWHRPRSANN